MNIDNKRLRILIVDDTVKNIQVLGTILRKEEYQINVAQNGLQALDVVSKARPDIILLDIMMPELDGFETCQRLKSNPDTADIPVIFLTAKVETEDIVKGFELGAVDYVTKPFNPTELLVRVRTHLSIHLLQSALKHAFNDISRMQREQETFLKRELTKRLMPIRDSAESLAQISHVLSEDVRIRISTLLNGVKDLASLVGTMQQIQDIESGAVKVDKATVDLAQLVNKAISELNLVYGGLVDVQCQNDLDNAHVVADAALMTGALQSLLQHAIEHVAPLAENVVKLHLLNENNRAVVHVRYGGESVPPEQLANFFEKFSADMPNTDTTGLETNYAYLVTTAHGGEISVISDDISGTTVTMILPQ